MFSSAVTTSAEQRAKTLYSLDHADSIDFCVTWIKYRHQKQAAPSCASELDFGLNGLLLGKPFSVTNVKY